MNLNCNLNLKSKSCLILNIFFEVGVAIEVEVEVEVEKYISQSVHIICQRTRLLNGKHGGTERIFTAFISMPPRLRVSPTKAKKKHRSTKYRVLSPWPSASVLNIIYAQKRRANLIHPIPLNPILQCHQASKF